MLQIAFGVFIGGGALLILAVGVCYLRERLIRRNRGRMLI